MPFLRVLTNSKISISTDELAEKASELIAEELHKPIDYVVVTIKQNRDMYFGDDKEIKGVLAYMDSIGFGGQKASLARKLTDLFLDNMPSVSPQNVNITFYDMPASDVAIGGNLMG